MRDDGTRGASASIGALFDREFVNAARAALAARKARLETEGDDDALEAQRIARAHELACAAMRSAPTAEERAAARDEALRLEALMVK